MRKSSEHIELFWRDTAESWRNKDLQSSKILAKRRLSKTGLGYNGATKRARETTHWHLTFRTFEQTTPAHGLVTLWIEIPPTLHLLFAPRIYLFHLIGMRETPWTTPLGSPIGFKVWKRKPIPSDRSDKEVTWSEWSSEYEYSSMSLVRKASLYALELELFWNSSIGKVNSGQNTNGILEIQVYRTAWCWPLAPLPWRITIPTVLVSLKWGPSMLFAKFTSASWSSFYDYFFFYIYIIIYIYILCIIFSFSLSSFFHRPLQTPVSMLNKTSTNRML